jgi:hypothetical protein
MNGILEMHYIDAMVEDRALPIALRQDDFEGFMASRSRMILAKIESVMGKAITVMVETLEDDSMSTDSADE